MGGDWRSGKDYSHSTEPQRSSVPSWEKTFCTAVCHVPWDRICAAKTWLPSYEKIADWKDSGALENFQNAKARYWAEINGAPCKVPFPNPDIYNDEVDYDAVIDPELIADLYRKPPPPPCSSNEYDDLSYESFLNRSLTVKATGWGDPEEGDRTEGHPSGWDDTADDQRAKWNGSGNLLMENDGCDTAFDRNGSWKDNSLENQRKDASWGQCWENWNNEQRRRNGGMKRNSVHGSRFLKPRHHQQSNYTGARYCEKTTRCGKPPVFMGQQWLPKSHDLMNAQKLGQ